MRTLYPISEQERIMTFRRSYALWLGGDLPSKADDLMMIPISSGRFALVPYTTGRRHVLRSSGVIDIVKSSEDLTGFDCGAFCFVKAEHPLYLKAHSCVLKRSCPKCSSPQGEPCRGVEKPCITKAHSERLRERP